MKKTFKIIGITLASTVGVILIVAGIALATVASPKQLTKLVKRYLPKMVDYDIRFDKAQLTLKTFPEIGVDLEGVALLSPMDDAPSDTLASIAHLVVAADAEKFLKEKAIVLHSITLDEVFANLFTNAEGRSNLDIFVTDSTAKDTTATTFDYTIDLSQLTVRDGRVLYADLRSGTRAEMDALDLTVKGCWDSLSRIHADMTLQCDDISLFAGCQALEHDRVQVELRSVDLTLDTLSVAVAEIRIGLNDYLVHLPCCSIAALPSPTASVRTDNNDAYDIRADFSTNLLDIEDVLRRLPESVRESLDGLDFKGRVALTEGRVRGVYSDTTMPVITAHVAATDATVGIAQLPYPFVETELQTLLSIDLNDSINARDITLKTRWGHSPIELTGSVTDITDQMRLDAKLKGRLPMSDLRPFLPDDLGMDGTAKLNLSLHGTLDDLLRTVSDYDFNTRLKARADLTLRGFGFDMDSIHAASDQMDLALALPGAKIELTAPHLTATVGEGIHADMDELEVVANAKKIKGGMAEMVGNATVSTGPMSGAYNGTSLKAEALGVSASTNLDIDFILTQAELTLDGLEEKVIVPSIRFDYGSDHLDFKEGGIRLGRSDLGLRGQVSGLKAWAENHEQPLFARLSITSERLDVNEILDLTSGLGAAPDTTASSEKGDEPTEGEPFMVPLGVDFALDINAEKALYGNFEFNHLGGSANVKDGTIMLREMGFTNEAARMELTALYQSPRKNHLFVGMDFHLIDVQIHDLLHMIPEIDTIVPMLKTFDGTAEFHIAAQANLKSNYELKMSTLRAAADIEGANLQVRDIGTFTRITDLLDISTDGRYAIDSIDVQLTAFKNEVDLWPFQIAIGKYKATVDGHYNLNSVGEYHISVTESPLPTRLGLKISGPLNDLSYSLEPCKYPHLYKPSRRNDTEQMVMDLKRRIAEELKK